MTDTVHPTEQNIPRPEEAGGAAALILRRARHVLDATPMSGDFTANSLWGQELHQKTAAGEELFVLDVRNRGDYERGHIPGALHVDFHDWAQPASLAALPVDMRIIVVCDTGVLASQVVAGLRLLGFDAHALKSGIHGWAGTEAGAQLAQGISSAAGMVERTPPQRTWPEKESVSPFGRPSPDEYAEILDRAFKVMEALREDAGAAGHVMSQTELDSRIASGAEDLFLLDLRREEDYEGVGHIAGAVHVDFDSALSEAALALLPRQKKIVTICYTGNLAAQVAMMLRLMGHDAAVLEYGMVAWTRTPTAFHYLKDLKGASGRLESGV